MQQLSVIGGLRRKAALGATATVLALAVLTTSAAAAEPTLRITTPAAGSYTRETTPVIGGALEPDEGVWCGVTIKIYEGPAAEGTPVEIPLGESSSLCSNWQAAPEPLGQGTYTVLAEETVGVLNGEGEFEELPAVTSHAVTFTVDTTPPSPAISAPALGATYFEGAIPVNGTAGASAGDQHSVLVRVFAGMEETAPPVESVETAVEGTSWSGTLAGLAPGSYTLSAEQSDAAGNVGTSAPVPIVVLATPAPPPPTAAFTWFPEVPRAGETVTLVSSSTDLYSPITAFGWALTPTAAFAAGRSTTTATFTTPGAHVVRLQVADAAGRSATASKTILVRHQAITLMQPFPIVRIAGRETRNGVKLTLLTVAAPVSARITVRIQGKHVRTTSQSRVATVGNNGGSSGTSLVSFPRFARTLLTGTTLEIRVTKPGEIGKLTRFIPRRGRLPMRVDRCLNASEQPIPCPSS
jgi:PKD domain